MDMISRAHHLSFVFIVSAENSYLEVPDLGALPGTSKIDMKIVAVDQDGTPLKQGGDQFTASITVNGQPQVGVLFSFKMYLS